MPFISEGQDNSICWRDDLKLKWSDFQGVVPQVTNWSAVCSAELLATGCWSNNLPNFKITNCFDRNASWTDDTTSAEGLKHEQLHFDIAEIHARRMRKSVDSLRQLGETSFEPYSLIIQELLDRRNKIDSIYDEETAHSIFLKKQELWAEKIKNEIKELEAYSADSVRCICD